MTTAVWNSPRIWLWRAGQILRSLASLVQHPTRRYGRRYFSPASATRSRWKSYKQSAWFQDPNQPHIHSTFQARATDGEMFYTVATIDMQAAVLQQDPKFLLDIKEYKERVAGSWLQTYLAPKCRCKLGWHWGCKVHRTWRN